MANSILDSVKKMLGLADDYTEFDLDIIMHINSTFATLNQLGIGPADGYMIEDSDATWDDYLEDELRVLQIPTYVYLKVRLLFDPPATSFAIDAVQKQILELEWRINVVRENVVHTIENYEGVLDGGTP